MSNFIVKLYISTIRKLLSNIHNRKVIKQMKEDDVFVKIKDHVISDAISTKSMADVEKKYKKYYNSYIYDPLNGVYDRSSRIEVIAYNKGGDCDDMSEVFRFFFYAYFKNLGLSKSQYLRAVKVYSFRADFPMSFIGKFFKQVFKAIKLFFKNKLSFKVLGKELKEAPKYIALTMAHCMCVVDINKITDTSIAKKIRAENNGRSLILGDYGLYGYTSYDDIKEHYCGYFRDLREEGYEVEAEDIKMVEIPYSAVYPKKIQHHYPV